MRLVKPKMVEGYLDEELKVIDDGDNDLGIVIYSEHLEHWCFWLTVSRALSAEELDEIADLMREKETESVDKKNT